MQLFRTMAVASLSLSLSLSIFLFFWFVGFCFVSMLNLLFVFLGLDAGETEIMTNIKEMGELEKRLELFVVDILHYQSIIGALKGCSALFCCLDSLDGYDVSDWF